MLYKEERIRARANIKHNFNKEKMISTIENLYKKILSLS